MFENLQAFKRRKAIRIIQNAKLEIILTFAKLERIQLNKNRLSEAFQ